MGTLIAEDLLLLLLDDELGSMTTSYADAVLGGALLGELALAGAVTVPEKASVWRTAEVRPSREPVGEPGLRDRLADGLVERGILERREDRVLGLFARKRWPAIDSSREEELHRALTVVLVQGADPRRAHRRPGGAAVGRRPGAPGRRPLRQLLPRSASGAKQVARAPGPPRRSRSPERLTRPDDGRVRISRGRPGRCRG